MQSSFGCINPDNFEFNNKVSQGIQEIGTESHRCKLLWIGKFSLLKLAFHLPATNIMRISLVEDNPDISEYLQDLFTSNNEFEFVASYPDANSGINGILKQTPDMAIIDLGLPDRHGSECIRELRKELPELKIVVFTVFEDEQNIINAIKLGANGYLLKDTAPDLFLLELQVVMQGGASLTPRVAFGMMGIFNEGKKKDSPLTARESEVLHLIALGFKYNDIADEMDLSPNTVRRYIERIYQKLNVNSKSEAIIKGRRQGLLGRLYE